MRILIAEDEAKTRRYLEQGLREQGFSVETTGNGGDALVLLQENSFDAAILDVMMPGADGWSVVKALRAEGNATPVLFLTARDRVEDRVRGFEIGGDDYLIKPFAFAELLARLRNLTRRAVRPVGDGILRLDDLLLDPLRHHVERAGRPLQLTAKEYALLLLLMRNPSRVLSRTLIAESIWGLCSDVQTNVVDVLVRRLRAKVDTPFGKPLLQTIRGAGYMMDGDDA
ncbi:MAG: response regulator [Alphaproteobacteria bacterium]|nr:response regulator [Alphaproteobacteria bacterium]MBU6473628.1 response regulator [Alphaproteobacteria bacterium]MDE2075340.1 response regulator [Alphaproteobacteria bacterium]